MVRIEDWLSVRYDGTATLHFSVRKALRQPLADALAGLKAQNLQASKSEIIAQAVIEKWERERPREGENDE